MQVTAVEFIDIANKD